MHISTRSDLIGITLPKMSQVVQEDAYYAIWRAREVLNHSNQLSEGHNGIFIFFQDRRIFNYVLRGHYRKCAFGAINKSAFLKGGFLTLDQHDFGLLSIFNMLRDILWEKLQVQVCIEGSSIHILSKSTILVRPWYG